jgi:Fur family transcriptional regulator, ferric uptake regulator
LNQKIAYLKNVIERGGHRFTFQKERVLEVLLGSKVHLNAKEIYDSLKPHGIGMATIYRNLDQFIELGVVKVLYIHGTSYYEMKIYRNKPLHIHFKCIECNELKDIDSDWDMEYIKLNYEIEKSCNLEIHDVDILLKGICEVCKKNK